MKKMIKLISIIAIVSMLFVGCTQFSGTDISTILPEIEETTYVQCGEYEVIANRLLVGYENIEALNFTANKLGAQVLVTMPEIKAAALKIPGNVEETISRLKSNHIEGIRYVEPSYKRELIEPDVQNAALDQTRDPNDTLYPYLWGAKKINAEAVWNLGYTGEDVVVAVCDGGSDASHPDLAGQYVAGYLAPTNQEIPAGDSIPYGSHGTHVSGTIAAVRNNGEGIVGVAPDAKIMPIPVFAPDFIGDGLVTAAWIWAVDNGAKILQNSWGGPGYSHTLKAGIDYAIENGAIVVVSTGNTHIVENWGFPNTAPGVIGVGASNSRDELTDFSSRGDSVSVVAPGESILSTIGMDDPATLQGGLPYSFYNGTSMASPHVSGLAALLYEKYPNATPYEMRKLIEDSAVDLDAPGYDENTGYGRIDAHAAIQSSSSRGLGGNLTITVKNSIGNVAVPFVNVTLKRQGKPSYYAQADQNGICSFRAIDPDVYDIYISGPDYVTLGSRLQEEVQVFYGSFTVEEQSVLEIKFNSTFSAELKMPTGSEYYLAKIIDGLGNSQQLLTAQASETITFTKPTLGSSPYFFLSVEPSPTLNVPSALLTESFETGDFSSADWSWVFGGDATPTITDTNASIGTYSAQFGDIDDSQSCWMETSPNIAAGEYWLKFDIKLSTEEGWDFVNVYVDGQPVWNGSGIYDWQTVTVPYLSGNITFEYVKDTAYSTEKDTAWIDNIRIIPIPNDFDEYNVTGELLINGHSIPVSQNLYLGNFVDEFELDTIPWLIY